MSLNYKQDTTDFAYKYPADSQYVCDLIAKMFQRNYDFYVTEIIEDSVGMHLGSEVIDVTKALQCLVKDSKLVLQNQSKVS